MGKGREALRQRESEREKPPYNARAGDPTGIGSLTLAFDS